MEVVIPKDSDGPEFSWMTRRFRDKDGLMIGNASDNPILDTHVNGVE